MVSNSCIFLLKIEEIEDTSPIGDLRRVAFTGSIKSAPGRVDRTAALASLSTLMISDFSLFRHRPS